MLLNLARAQRKYAVAGFGETLLRMSTEDGQQLEDTVHLAAHVGGSESNVCAALAQLDRRTLFLGAVPNNRIGELVINKLRSTGIDTRFIKRIDDSRLGIYYYLSAGINAAASQIIYDRKNSAFTRLIKESLPVDVFGKTKILHTTGITSALSPTVRELQQTTIDLAAHHGTLFSFDVNYRAHLWDVSEARSALMPLINQADVLFSRQGDVSALMGDVPDALAALKELRQHTDAAVIVVSSGRNGAYAEHNGKVFRAEAPQVAILDRPGAGDALAAGVLDGLLDGDIALGLRRGVHLAALKLSRRGDMLFTSRKEFESVERLSTQEDLDR